MTLPVQSQVPSSILCALVPLPSPDDKDKAFGIVMDNLPQFTSRLLDGTAEGLSELPRIGGRALKEC